MGSFSSPLGILEDLVNSIEGTYPEVEAPQTFFLWRADLWAADSYPYSPRINEHGDVIDQGIPLLEIKLLSLF